MRLIFNSGSYILALLTLFLCSCSLFKKTSKTTELSTQSSIKRLESSQMLLKTSGMETQIFTYWNDSGFYQYQHIKEQIDQAKSDQLLVAERQEAKHSFNTKKVEPIGIWIYGVVLLALVCCYPIIKRVFYS